MVRLLPILLLLAACDPGFEDPTIVLDLRMLAVEADRPELVLDFDPDDPAPALEQLAGSPITLRVLVADPGPTPRRLQWDMTLCPTNNDLRCEPDDVSQFLAEGIVEDPEAMVDPPTATFTIGLPVLEDSIQADDLAGFGGVAVMVQIRIWPEGQEDLMIWGAKRLVVAPREPPGRTPNTNPTLEALAQVEPDGTMTALLPSRCEDTSAPGIELAPEEEIALMPLEPEGVRETYMLPTFDGDVRTITENMRYSWFSTAGSWARGGTGGTIDPFGNVPPLDTAWTAPSETGDYRLWMVMRDERAGTYWLEFCARVR